MGKFYIDPNLFMQTALDSGALTMHGSIVHQFDEPGEYRGTVRRGDEIERVFYLSVDKESSVAAADIDLAKLAGVVAEADCDKCKDDDAREARFSVNPRGYVLFRVSGGKGGYSVNLRQAKRDDKTPVFNSKVLTEGARFATRILRPGTYAVSNGESGEKAELTVSYPPEAFSNYQPPAPQTVKVTGKGFEPNRIELKPAQGLIFECGTLARILIELVKPDDGPKRKKSGR